MFRRKRTFIQKFYDLVKEEGFDSISDFVDDWIVKGGTFQTIYEMLLLKGFTFNKYTIWLNLRKYLTVGYGEEAYWYKWNALARAKGYDTIADWMEENKDKFTTLEMAREFDISVRPIEKLIVKLNILGNKETKKFEKRCDSEGFSMTNAKERWMKMLNERGYETMREAMLDLNSKGYSLGDIAYEFNTTKKTIKRRLKRANIVLVKKKVA